MEQTPTASQPPEPPPVTPQPPAAGNSTPTPTSSAPPSLPPPITPSSFSNTNPIPAPKPQTTSQSQQSASSQARTAFNTRPWQAGEPYSHFSLPSPPPPASSAAPSSSISAPPPPRGGMAIGVPAHNPSTPPPPPASFSSLAPPSFAQQSQIRQPIQGIGMTGALGMTSSMRPTGIPPNQLRPSQSPLRPQTSSSGQSPSAQNFQGHSMFRASSLGSPGSPSPSSSQGPQSQNQLWLSSGIQGKPPLPTTSLRPQTSPQSFQQRSQISQQHHHNMSTTPQQQTISSTQPSPQPSTSGQAQEHFSGQFPASRIQQSITNQQQISRGLGLGTQRPPLGTTQSITSQPGASSKPATADTEEPSNRILSKRSIQELVNQIDPSEKLDPMVEDILVDIAEDFVESITTFGCSLAKHRKSSTLEAKDILLHLEKNWNMSLPGFGGDEIRTYKKPIVSEVHKERLAAVKKSMFTSDKTLSGPSGGSAKGHLAKGPAVTIGSPRNPKIREAA